MLTASEKPTRAPRKTWAHWKVASRNKESDHLSFRFGPPREGRFHRPNPPPLLRPSAIGVTCTSQECFSPQPGEPTQVYPGPCSFCASSWLLPRAAPWTGSGCCELCCEETVSSPGDCPSVCLACGLAVWFRPFTPWPGRRRQPQTKYNSAHTG